MGLKKSLFCYLIIVIFSSVSLVSLVEAQSNWVTFRNTQFKFRFIYPPDWQVGIPRGKNVRGKVFSPNKKSFASCNIVVIPSPEISNYSQKDLDKEIHAEVWSKSDWLGQIRNKFPDADIAERRKIKIDNQPAQFAVYTTSYETMNTKVYAKSMVFATFTPGYGWFFTCGAGGENKIEAERNYEHWKSTFTKLFGSFVFEK